LRSFANDYSPWDDMMTLVRTGDPLWTKVNIEDSLNNFGAQAAWVLRPDGWLVYRTGGLSAEAMAACRKILASEADPKVLILTSVIDDNLVYDAMSSGAHGYLLKEINAEGLCQAIVDVVAGRFILDPSVTAYALNLVRNAGSLSPEQDKLETLSAQELRVLALVAEGKTNKEIAEQMGLSDTTVKNYPSNVFEKLKISRRSKAVVLNASRHGPASVR
jgi:DNA-binding NarL/FixJ family response regulator